MGSLLEDFGVVGFSTTIFTCFLHQVAFLVNLQNQRRNPSLRLMLIASQEKDPQSYNAVYNLAVLYYNEAVELIKEKNNLGISAADLKKAEEMQAGIDKRLEDALPYWEKANALQPGDRTTLETLQYIYVQTKQMEKAQGIKSQLDNMSTEQQNEE